MRWERAARLAVAHSNPNLSRLATLMGQSTLQTIVLFATQDPTKVRRSGGLMPACAPDKGPLSKEGTLDSRRILSKDWGFESSAGVSETALVSRTRVDGG
jgi:hypothetical protein